MSGHAGHSTFEVSLTGGIVLPADFTVFPDDHYVLLKVRVPSNVLGVTAAVAFLFADAAAAVSSVETPLYLLTTTRRTYVVCLSICRSRCRSARTSSRKEKPLFSGYALHHRRSGRRCNRASTYTSLQQPFARLRTCSTAGVRTLVALSSTASAAPTTTPRPPQRRSVCPPKRSAPSTPSSVTAPQWRSGRRNAAK